MRLEGWKPVDKSQVLPARGGEGLEGEVILLTLSTGTFSRVQPTQRQVTTERVDVVGGDDVGEGKVMVLVSW